MTIPTDSAYVDAFSQALKAYHRAADEYALQRKVAAGHHKRLLEAHKAVREAHEELVAWVKRTTLKS